MNTSATSGASAAPRILAVDDVDMNLEILRDLAASLTLEIDTAHTAAQALALAERTAYGLLLLDLQLPDFNGDELLTRIRNGAGLSKRTPAFLITGELDAARVPALKASGFQQIYAKPYEFKQLKAAVAEIVGIRADSQVKQVVQGSTATTGALFDDPRAMAAIGHSETVMLKMRALFGKELSERWNEISVTRTDRAAHREALHKLSGSCAMVAAIALEHAIANYRLHLDDAELASAWQRLEACVLDYLRALGR
jgi:CheY-like chemotaxis protein